ncbi:cytochrome b/b6 [Rhodomicrobium udaipurense]|uniref:Cytochrome b n=2 Tax=Rhodomicrobium udaipurense TaxID=1202716 RepID=A0A8I1GIT1_9HYPH|nr:cytochrome b/b6 [Rhodomicrobium udaipurense]MBJ7545161.1 cytochrome b/b6 [Rhodomicrobium udaipurense]
MSHASTYEPKTSVTRWLDARLPIIRFIADFMVFPTPRNLNYLWTFGAILAFMLIAQIVTGVILAMHFAPNTALAFDSVEKIMRDVNYGWLLRYAHAVGASMFFLAVYIHMFRGIYYGSYKAPREVLWMIGVAIFLVMMATAFMGYSLIWGQMSFWAVTVITNLFSSLDTLYSGLGTTLVQWIWGGFSVDNATLNRLFSLHYLLPFVLVGLVALHVWALHVVGSNNPTGVEVKNVEKETLPFYAYFTTKDLFALAVFGVIFAYFIFFTPNYLGDAVNYVPANPLLTPPHIVPEWYFLPFYAILRAVPSKLGGVLAMFGAIAVLFFIPWLDTSRVRSLNYRPMFRWFFWGFVFSCLALGYLGAAPVTETSTLASQFFTFYYFAFFLILMPVVGIYETPKPQPDSIADTFTHKSDDGSGRGTRPVAAE